MSVPRIPEALQPDLADRLRARFGAWPLIAPWGVTLSELQPGRAELVIAANASVTNGPRGQINGGVLAALADLASALALCTAFDGRMPFATDLPPRMAPVFKLGVGLPIDQPCAVAEA